MSGNRWHVLTRSSRSAQSRVVNWQFHSYLEIEKKKKRQTKINSGELPQRVAVIYNNALPYRLPRQKTTHATELKSISSYGEQVPVWEQLVMDQFDPWQVVPRKFLHNIPACWFQLRLWLSVSLLVLVTGVIRAICM